MTLHPRFCALILAAGIVLRLNTFSASADTYYWDVLATKGAGGGAGSWDDMTSAWSTASTGGTDTLWINFNDAVFAGTAGTVTLGAPEAVGAITVSTASYTINTVAGAPLTINGGIIATLTTGVTTFSGAGGLVFNGNQSISVLSGMNFNAPLSGSGVLTKTGAGSLALATSNSAFTGKFVVTAGLLGINSDAALGAVPSTFRADDITLNGGGLADATNFSSPTKFSDSGSFALNANRGITLASGGGTFRVGFGSADVLTVNGVISGVGSLTKIDSGTLALNANNTYQGVTNITGTLQVGAGGTTGSVGAGDVVFASGTTNYLNFNRADNVTMANNINTGGQANIGAVAQETVTLTGAITGAGQLWTYGAGTVVINANTNSSRTTGNVIFSGNLQVSDLTRNANSALGSGGIVIGQSTTPPTGAGLIYTGGSISTDAISYVSTPYGSINVTNAGTTLTTTSVIKGADSTDVITKLGAGTLSLAGTGDNVRLRVQLNAGTLLLSKVSASGVHAVAGTNAVIQNGGLMQITGAGGDQIYDPSSVQQNGGVFDLNGNSESFDGIYNTVPGGSVTNNLAGTTSTLGLGVNNGSYVYFGNMQDGAGALAVQKSGTGALTLGGANVLGGGLAVSAGRLVIKGSVTGATTVAGGVLGGTGTTGNVSVSGGTVSPGTTATGAAIGTLSTGTLDLTKGGTFAATISTLALTSSLEAISGDLDLGSSVAILTLTDIGAATADPVNTKFTIMSYTGQWDGGLFSFGSAGAIAENGTFLFGANTFELTYDVADAQSGIKDVVLTVVSPATVPQSQSQSRGALGSISVQETTAVPEPTAASGLLFGGMVLLSGWRPRRKAAALTGR